MPRPYNSQVVTYAKAREIRRQKKQQPDLTVAQLAARHGVTGATIRNILTKPHYRAWPPSEEPSGYRDPSIPLPVRAEDPLRVKEAEAAKTLRLQRARERAMRERARRGK